jgi:hypothetical protein
VGATTRAEGQQHAVPRGWDASPQHSTRDDEPLFCDEVSESFARPVLDMRSERLIHASGQSNHDVFQVAPVRRRQDKETNSRRSPKDRGRIIESFIGRTCCEVRVARTRIKNRAHGRVGCTQILEHLPQVKRLMRRVRQTCVIVVLGPFVDYPSRRESFRGHSDAGCTANTFPSSTSRSCSSSCRSLSRKNR